MPSDIILIGPVRTGKTTVGRLLAEQLGLPNITLDDLRWEYYAEVGYDPDLAQQIRRTGGFVALVFYWKLFDAHAVERVLADHRNCIFNFGAGHTVNENSVFADRIRRALAPYPNVFLILPSPDPEESIRILDARTADLPGAYGQGFNWNEYFVRHPANYELAKHIVYTNDRAPQETAVEILATAGKSHYPGNSSFPEQQFT